MKVIGRAAAVVFFSLFVASINVASGATLYYTSSPGSPGSSSAIYQIDTATGNDSLLTTITNVTYYDLASSPIPNTVYAMDGLTGVGCLYTFNVSTFANHKVGCASVNLHGAAYDATNGILYSTDNIGLYTVNTSTGAETSIANFFDTTASINLTSVFSSDYDAGTGTLYIADSNTGYLYTVDTTTAVATRVGPGGFPSGLFDIYVDPTTGNMFGVGGTGPSSFYSINKTAGTFATVKAGITGTYALGLAAPLSSQATGPVAAPALNTWALLLLSVMLVGVGGLLSRRRQAGSRRTYGLLHSVAEPRSQKLG